MDAPFISETTAASIKRAQSRLFQTAKLLGNTVNLLLFRDSDEDGSVTQIGPHEVLVIYARREASRERSQGTEFMGGDGELQKEWPADFRKHDRFVLPSGATGRLTTEPIEDGGIVRVPFVLEL